MHLLDFLRGRYSDRTPPAVSPRGFKAQLPQHDDDEFEDGDQSSGDSVNGLTVIICYRDSKGAASTRQISCVRIEVGKGKRYLRAFCHHRRALRMFLIDRIDTVSDAETGEELADGDEFFGQYADDRISASPPGWGLSPVQRADLGAGLTVLTFLSRCDGKMHPLEEHEIDTFTSAWWIRAEIRADLPEGDIAAHSRRLAPDVEAFALAAERVRGNRILAPLVAGYARRVVEADDVIAKEEGYWISRLADWLEDAQ